MTTTPLDLPHGFTARPSRAADAAIVHEVVLAHHVASGGLEPYPLVELLADLENPRIDVERDTWLVLDATGRAAAWGIVYLDNAQRCAVDLYVQPDLERGVAVALARSVGEAGVVRIREHARSRGTDTVTVVSAMISTDELLPEVFDALGLVEARSYWRMVAGPDALAAAQGAGADGEGDGVAGYRVVRVDANDEDVLRTAHALSNDTFSEHYGHVDETWDEFVAWTRSAAGFDPTAFWFAYDAAAAPVALLFGDERHADSAGGYVAKLGVQTAHRARGLGRALLSTAFREYASRGRTQVMLGVDSGNETGAVRLYESVGMTTLDVITSYERTVPTATP